MADQFAYLTTTGRRSVAPHEIEIWFAAVGDTLWMLSGGRDGSDSVRNLQADQRCRVRIGHNGTERAAVARFPDGDEEAAVREALFAKYQPGGHGDLSSWRDGALVVALDLVRS